MMTEPKIEELRTKADSKFALVMGVARRTRQIIEFMNALGRGDTVEEGILPPPIIDVLTKKPLMISLDEIVEGRVKIIYKERAGGEEGEVSVPILEGQLEELKTAELTTEAEEAFKEAGKEAPKEKAEQPPVEEAPTVEKPKPKKAAKKAEPAKAEKAAEPKKAKAAAPKKPAAKVKTATKKTTTAAVDKKTAAAAKKTAAAAKKATAAAKKTAKA